MFLIFLESVCGDASVSSTCPTMIISPRRYCNINLFSVSDYLIPETTLGRKRQGALRARTPPVSKTAPRLTGTKPVNTCRHRLVSNHSESAKRTTTKWKPRRRLTPKRTSAAAYAHESRCDYAREKEESQPEPATTQTSAGP